MSKVMISESILTDVANAIRQKIDSGEQFTPEEMAQEILGIKTSNADVLVPPEIPLNATIEITEV